MLYEYQTAPLLEKLRAGEIDVGILALPVPLDGLEAERAVRRAIHAGRARGPPLADRERVQRGRPARARRCCCSRTGTACATRRSRSAAASGYSEEQDYRATSLETLRQMVAAGHGVTLLPELAAESPVGTARGMRDQAVRRSPAPARTIGAVWRKSTTRAPGDRGHRRATIRAAMKEESKR